MSTLAAGTFIGPVGSVGSLARSVRVQGPTMISRTGAGVRQSIADQYLRTAGMSTRGGLALGRLGDGPNLCTDPGWQFAQALIGAAGAGVSAGAGTDQGWLAAGATASGLTSAWQQTCAAQAAAAGAMTGGAGATTQGDTAAAVQAALAAQAAAAQQDQIRLQQQQLTQQRQQSAQTQQYLMIGGGLLAVIVVGAFLFRK